MYIFLLHKLDFIYSLYYNVHSQFQSQACFTIILCDHCDSLQICQVWAHSHCRCKWGYITLLVGKRCAGWVNIQTWHCRKALWTFWIHSCDCCHALHKTCAEIHLGCGAMSSCWPPLFECPIQQLLVVKLSGMAHEGACHSFVIVVIHWHLRAETHPWEGPYSEMCGCSREAWCFKYHGHHTYTISCFLGLNLCHNTCTIYIASLHLFLVCLQSGHGLGK